MDKLFQWHIDGSGHIALYVLAVVVFSLLIRAFLSVFSALALKHINHIEFRIGFRSVAWGFINEDGLRDRSDFLIPFFLGMLELGAFPILMKTDGYVIIGSWIGLKALAQWSTWKEHRFTFNRFLLGNALVVLASYILACVFILTPTPWIE